jgi:hypothetical protein
VDGRRLVAAGQPALVVLAWGQSYFFEKIIIFIIYMYSILINLIIIF